MQHGHILTPFVWSLSTHAAFFDDYADIARIASAAFMILQIIIILDYACTQAIPSTPSILMQPFMIL